MWWSYFEKNEMLVVLALSPVLVAHSKTLLQIIKLTLIQFRLQIIQIHIWLNCQKLLRFNYKNTFNVLIIIKKKRSWQL